MVHVEAYSDRGIERFVDVDGYLKRHHLLVQAQLHSRRLQRQGGEEVRIPLRLGNWDRLDLNFGTLWDGDRDGW